MTLDLLVPSQKEIFSASTYAEFKENLIQSQCSQCPELCLGRHNIVVDRGNPQAKIVAIGEAPGENEDLQGQAFVGRAGRLLDKVLLSVGLDSNKDMLIINIVKCRPPNNRRPTLEEAKNCLPFLKKQLEFVKPRVILLLGKTAIQHVIPNGKNIVMKDHVGKFFQVPEFPDSKFILLYHPAFLLRDPRKVTDMLEHLKTLKLFLEDEKII